MARDSVPLLFVNSVFGITPLCLCREAQRQADQETRMSEALAEFARLPPGASIAGCPGAAGVTETRVAFLLGPFLWRDKEKDLGRRAETRLLTQTIQQGLRQAQPERRRLGQPRSEQKEIKPPPSTSAPPTPAATRADQHRYNKGSACSSRARWCTAPRAGRLRAPSA